MQQIYCLCPPVRYCICNVMSTGYSNAFEIFAITAAGRWELEFKDRFLQLHDVGLLPGLVLYCTRLSRLHGLLVLEEDFEWWSFNP